MLPLHGGRYGQTTNVLLRRIILIRIALFVVLLAVIAHASRVNYAQFHNYAERDKESG